MATDGEFDLRAFADRYIAAWNDGDARALASLVTDDVIWSDPALPAPARGVGEVQEFMRSSRRTFPDLRFGEPDPPHLALQGEIATWAWTMEGTMEGPADPPGFAATGRRMAVEGIDLWIFSGGRIARYRAFYDTSELARQLGLAPPRGGLAEAGLVRLQRLQARLRRR